MLISAPAKLNRFLAILGKRADGYHNLELISTILTQVTDLTDILTAVPDITTSLHISGPQANGLTANDDNLVLRAWQLLESTVKRPLPAQIHLHKKIPHGAGLGGGSSDAAAALKLGNKLFKLKLSTSCLLTLGAQLGSDVPMFIVGGTVLSLDRGNRVFPLINIPLEPIIIIYPNLHVSTAKVYSSLASVGYPSIKPCCSLSKAMKPDWRNDLTDAAIWLCPDVNEVRKTIIESGGEPLLCGSGSCWAARYKNNDLLNKAHNWLTSNYPIWQYWKIN